MGGLQMPKIGFSTGCLHRTKLTLAEKIAFFKSVGADAIEIGLGDLLELMSTSISPDPQRTAKDFKYISIHAPWKNIRYGPNVETDAAIEKLIKLCDLLPITGIVIHPRKIDNFEKLEKSHLSFLIENSGWGKPLGALPEYFGRLKIDYPFGFVLDVQHAYEHDPSMILAKELIGAMGDRLKEMHVSGCTRELRHAPVHRSDNKDAIIKILELKFPAPKILEGVFLPEDDAEQTAYDELKLIKSYENDI